MERNLTHVLIVEDDEHWQDTLTMILKDAGYSVQVAAGYGEALGELLRDKFQLAIIDLRLPSQAEELSGMALLDHAFDRGIPTIVVTGYGTQELADEAIREHNAFGFIDKDVLDRARFIELVEKAVASRPGMGIAKRNVPELSLAISLRLDQLTDNVKQDLALLKNYEDALRYEDDPGRKARYRQQIERLRQSAARYQKEYDELRAQVTGEPSAAMQDVATQLRHMNVRLDVLQTTMTSVTEQLDQSQLATVQAVLDALKGNQVPEAEMRQMLDTVQQMLVTLQQSGVVLPSQQSVAEVIAAPSLDVKHKLKITLPIIPLLIGYEGVLELSDRLNLEALWKRWLARVRRE